MKAGRADPAGIECVPLMAAGAGPDIVLAGRPSAERAADARAGRIGVFLVAGFAIDDGRRIVSNRDHARYLIVIPSWRQVMRDLLAAGGGMLSAKQQIPRALNRRSG